MGHVEERSVSQVCELLLRKGIDAYKKEGAKYLRRSATGENMKARQIVQWQCSSQQRNR
jgi:hypothetical protein